MLFSMNYFRNEIKSYPNIGSKFEESENLRSLFKIGISSILFIVINE